MKTLAGVLVELNKPLELAEIEIPALKEGQALVRIEYSGVCHTQLLEARGHRGEDRFLPHCLGHEGSGVIEEIGPGVSKVGAGDSVILSWIKGSGANVPGSVYQWEGKNVNAGAVTTFSRYSVISENRLTRIPESFSKPYAALLGCAVPTGVGSVLNTARPRPGDSLAVFGCGGVGLCAIAAAKLAGCAPIVAVDLLDDKLKAAKAMGADILVKSGGGGPVEGVLDACPGGVDYAIEATGRPDVMAWALECARPQGGAAVVIGNAHHGESLSLNPLQFNLGKQLRGTWGGDCMPDADYPRFCKLCDSERLPLSTLIGKEYSLTDINKALDDLEGGNALRPMVNMNL